MTTYNTYQAAKIANPESEIVTTASEWIGGCDFIGKFQALDKHNNEEGYATHIVDGKHGWAKCNPADHCMTVEKFLADGYKFVEGDKFLNAAINPVELITVGGRNVTKEVANTPSGTVDGICYILRAAALEEKELLSKIADVNVEHYKKPRTKVEYVKCEFDKVSDLVIACESGEVFYCDNSIGGKIALEMYGAISMHRHSDSLYRRIETLMTEREEFIDECKKLEKQTAVFGKAISNKWFESMYESGKFKLVN